MALSAFLFAIAGAFANRTMPQDVFVHAKLKADPDGVTHCVNTKSQCDAAGSLACVVTVWVTNGSEVASTYGMFKTYSNSNCAIVMNSSDGGGTSGIRTIDKLVE